MSEGVEEAGSAQPMRIQALRWGLIIGAYLIFDLNHLCLSACLIKVLLYKYVYYVA
jgi:hypothetical protein